MSKPKSVGGLGLGDGPVALALTAVIFVLVAYLAITRVDLQNPEQAPGDDAHSAVGGAVRQESIEQNA